MLSPFYNIFFLEIYNLYYVFLFNKYIFRTMLVHIKGLFKLFNLISRNKLKFFLNKLYIYLIILN